MKQGVVRRGRRQSGLSLVELMIALGIIAIALLGVVSALTHTVRSKEAHRELAVAKQAATAKLEEIRAKATHSNAFKSTEAEYLPTLYPNNATFNVPGLNNTNNTAGNKVGLGTITLFPSSPAPTDRLFGYVVRIDWLGVQGWQKYEVRSMLTK